MTTGTKSVLFGVHQFVLHPIAVGRAWHFLHGRWPTITQWLCIFTHDLGYWGCADMDGPEGVQHPVKGANLAKRLVFFWCRLTNWNISDKVCYEIAKGAYDFTLGHSAHFAEKYLEGQRSGLYLADKASILFEPEWFYLLRARLSGEIKEYVTAQNPAWTEREWLNWYRLRVTIKVATYKYESSLHCGSV